MFQTLVTVFNQSYTWSLTSNYTSPFDRRRTLLFFQLHFTITSDFKRYSPGTRLNIHDKHLMVSFILFYQHIFCLNIFLHSFSVFKVIFFSFFLYFLLFFFFFITFLYFFFSFFLIMTTFRNLLENKTEIGYIRSTCLCNSARGLEQKKC